VFFGFRSLMASYSELLVENARLKWRISELEHTLNTLQKQIQQQQQTTEQTHAHPHDSDYNLSSTSSSSSSSSSSCSAPSASSSFPSPLSWSIPYCLSPVDLFRYSRQLLLSDLGRPTLVQSSLLSSRVLIIGAGGLGSPVALYLAAAGVGHLGIVDPDLVDESNLHRQIVHQEKSVGRWKAESARDACRGINSRIEVVAYNCRFDEKNALEIADSYDVLIDCSDNVPTRYLCNDIAVMKGVCLVSGSALKMEGQLTVYGTYHWPKTKIHTINKQQEVKEETSTSESNSSSSSSSSSSPPCSSNCSSVPLLFPTAPCYRCLYPTPPPPLTVTNCSDGGVIGPVVGVIGSLQALECIKIIALISHHKQAVDQSHLNVDSTSIEASTASFSPLSASQPLPSSSTSSSSSSLSPSSDLSILSGRFLVFDGCSLTFRVVKLRTRNPNCAVCGTHPTITPQTLAQNANAYQIFCSARMDDKAESSNVNTSIPSAARVASVNVNVLSNQLTSNLPCVLLDVREPVQFDLCRIQKAINIPLRHLKQKLDSVKQLVRQEDRKKRRTETRNGIEMNADSSSSSLSPIPVYVMCRRGLDSLAASEILQRFASEMEESRKKSEAALEDGKEEDCPPFQCFNVSGGLVSWRDKVDPTFPIY